LPTYEYECPDCSFRFELRRSFTENSPVSCPQCGCDAQLVFSPVPIIFKGSGFYSTDHRGNHGHSEPADTAEKIEKASKDETKTDSTEKAKTSSTDKQD
jgi:putative FmdB family regulatory protein